MMRLTQAELVRFGRFRNYTVSFQEGLNVLYGDNEAGKSTLQLFLRVMLYGIPNQRKTAGGALRDRERILPWGEKRAQGILRLEADGRALEIRRQFGSTPAKDQGEVLDCATGEPAGDYTPENVGEKLFGVPAGVFEKTLWLRQDGAAIAGQDQELGRRLMNLRDTGEEEVSAEQTLQTLDRIQYGIKARNRRNSDGTLDLLLRAREEKQQERYRLLTQQRQREDTQRRLEAARQSLAQTEAELTRLRELQAVQRSLLEQKLRLEKWEQARQILEKEQEILNQDEYRRFENLTPETAARAETLEDAMASLAPEPEAQARQTAAAQRAADAGRREGRGKAAILIGLLILLLGLVLAVCRLPGWVIWLAVCGGAGLLGILLGLWTARRSRASQAQAEAECQTIEEAARQRQSQYAQAEAELSSLTGAFGCESAAELRAGLVQRDKAAAQAEGLRQTYVSLMEGEEPETLAGEAEAAAQALAAHRDLMNQDYGRQLQEANRRQTETAVRIKELEGKLSYVYQGERNPADVETELLAIQEDMRAQEQRLRAVELAREVFTEVYERRRADFTPRLNAKVNEYLGILTEGKYQDVRVAQDYRMRLAAGDSDLCQAEYFSRGTYEQIYFALRLGLGALLGDGREPLLLDDLMMTYDDQRAQAAMELLRELAQRRQILLFTCHGRDRKNAEAAGAAVKDLEQEARAYGSGN